MSFVLDRLSLKCFLGIHLEVSSRQLDILECFPHHQAVL